MTTNGAWRDDAACLEIGTDMFFTDDNGGYPSFSDAKKICHRCSVTEQCLQDALDTNEIYGIRGGTTPKERLKMRTT